MKNLLMLLKKEEKLIIGLMSGTSLDGVDAALVKVKNHGLDTKMEIIDGLKHEYPSGLKEKLISIINEDNALISEISKLNFLIGKIFADAVLELVSKSGLAAEDIDLIGSHGQTIWHQPNPENVFGESIKSTLQIGEPSVINAVTGIITVADFRPKDVAYGGEGAPFIPYFDYLAYYDKKKNTGSLNIGGISNITIIPAGRNISDIIAFDTGPGNILIDGAVKYYFDMQYDDNGRIASAAEVDQNLLCKLMDNSFLKKTPPKSTGREEFGHVFLKNVYDMANELNCSGEALISTLTEYTACSIYYNYKRFIESDVNISRLIVSGGGSENSELIIRLKKYFENVDILISDEIGVPSALKEAAAFAVFANETIHGNAVNIPSVTGSEKAVICGKIIQ